MSRAKERARRGDIGLFPGPAGYWMIRWGRALSRRAGIPFRESTQTRERHQAVAILDRRRIEVFRSLGDDQAANAALRMVQPVGLSTLVSDYLRAYAAGDLPGRKPAKGTVDLTIQHLLGKRGGLTAFAATRRGKQQAFDVVLVTRWLEEESRRLSNDSVRMKLIVSRQLARFAFDRGHLTHEQLQQILARRPPPSARGRARADGVPGEVDLARLLDAIAPVRKGGIPFHKVAELQLRLGLRRGEVIAIESNWLDDAAGRVHVRVSDTFDTKSHASREIDGVDAATFALAREVLAIKLRHDVTASGYREAWRRACKRLEAAGTPWTFRNKSHALRAAYATQSRLAGVPLAVVRDRMGHGSERTTERHYVGRTPDAVPGPFEGRPTRSGASLAKVIPIKRAM